MNPNKPLKGMQSIDKGIKGTLSNKGWKEEPIRHGLAAQGIETGRKLGDITIFHVMPSSKYLFARGDWKRGLISDDEFKQIENDEFIRQERK